MEPKVNYTLVGLFVVLLGATAMVVVLWLSKADYRGVYDRYYTLMTESVSGLTTDSSVKYRGVDVGRVKEIVLDPANPEVVRLTLDLVRGTPVKENTIAVLETQGLTGFTTVNLTGGSRDSPPLTVKPGEKYPVIRSGPSLFFRIDSALSRILSDESLPRLLANLNNLTQDARGAVDEQNRMALKQILADLARVTHTLAARHAELDDSILRANEALGSFASLGKKMDEQIPEIMAQTKTSLQAFETMSREIERTTISLDSALDSNRSNIEQFTGQTLAETGILVSDLRQLTATLQRLAEELEREPSALIFGKAAPIRGPGE
ncbi:MAG TPA: MlaD family protein [Candidatus Acidoferrales bacterium]|nr:MlaD family protein [Candidatus Acidoferrales bacterium]